LQNQKQYIILTLLVLTTMTFVSAQNVDIPDLNFKIALLTHNPTIDTNGDGQISVSEAIVFNGTINVGNKNISDLTGIEAFVNITQLHCYNNQLTSLDVSNNTALTQLRCENNQISSLDVSNNTALQELFCSYNQLTSLDLSSNMLLKRLECEYNQPLTSLNLKNGNNTNMQDNGYYIRLRSNPNLRCIQVDNASYSNQNWGAWYNKDNTACYSDNCVTPTFNIPTSVCLNATAPVLPTTSNNEISGTWSPATINTSVVGTQAYTFKSSNSTCAYNYSIDINVIANPVPPTGAPIQYFNPGQTLADLVVNGGNLVWYSDGSLVVNIPETTPLVNGITYYAIRQVGACKSSVFGVMVSDCANLNVPTPIGETTQPFITGQTLAVLNVSGDNLVWYSDNTYSDALSLTEPLVHGATYYVVNEIGYCRSEALAITVQDLLNRSNFDIFGFTYYPNPVNDILTFSSNQPIENVVVSNMLGQEVKTNLSSDKTSLDMSNLANGNYLVKVTIEGVSKTIKVVKL